MLFPTWRSFSFIAGKLAQRWTLLAFFECSQNRFSFVARFDYLALAKVFFGIVERIENHSLDLIVGQSVAGLHFDLGFLAAALFARRDVQNAVGVDQELDLNARHSRSHGRNSS